ncbi:MAG: DUF6279 family lipoprotein, partial [Pseudomonas sp.]
MGKCLRIALLISGLAVLTSCSRLELAYRNLDVLIPWSLDNYVTLTKPQKAWLKPRLAGHINWHCSTQLPAYAAWLQHSAELAGQPKPDAAAFDAQFTAFRHAVDAIAVQVTPDLTELLRGLNPAQVKELEENLAKQNKEQREDYLGVPLAEQIDERAERMEERLQVWFGRLSVSQKARIKAWSQELGDYNQGWLDNNLRWQQAVAPYQSSDIRRSVWQMFNTITPYFILWYLAYRSLEVSYLLT